MLDTNSDFPVLSAVRDQIVRSLVAPCFAMSPATRWQQQAKGAAAIFDKAAGRTDEDSLDVFIGHVEDVVSAMELPIPAAGFCHGAADPVGSVVLLATMAAIWIVPRE